MKYLFIATLISLIPLQIAFAQGCSDAGFCTMGAMRPDQPYNKKINLKLRSMELSYYEGNTPVSPTIRVVTADFNFGITDKMAFQIKVPYHMVKGSFAQTSGMGDLSLCLTRNIFNSEKFDINFSLGSKIPSNNSDLEQDGKPLPMYYQTSLGTYDFISGISLINRKWLFATGIQHPFNRNNNQFTWDTWPNYHDQNYVRRNSEALELKRGTDIMLRVERNFRLSKVNFTTGLLPIYRITHDEITDKDTGDRVKVPETTGLALSIINSVGYNLNVKSGFKAMYGHALVQRNRNPDGLTRDNVFTLSYYYRF